MHSLNPVIPERNKSSTPHLGRSWPVPCRPFRAAGGGSPVSRNSGGAAVGIAVIWLQLLSLAVTPSQAQVYGPPYVKANTYSSVSIRGLPDDQSGGRDEKETGILYLTDFGSAPIVAGVSTLVERDESHVSNGVRLIGRAESVCEARPGILRIRSSAVATREGPNYDGYSIKASAAEWVLAPSGPGTEFVDTITVRGGVPGTPVEVTVTAVFEGSTSRGGGEFSSSIKNQGSFSVRSTPEGGDVSLLHYGVDGTDIPFYHEGSSVCTVNVDEPFQLSGDVRATAEASRTGPGTTHSVFESMSTGRVFLSVPEGYSIETASGHDYAANSEPAVSFDAWVSAAGMTGEDAGRTASPRGDGVANLLKFAFNMDPLVPDGRRLTPDGGETAGLPSGEHVVLPDGRIALRMEYIRRKASSAPGISYAVQFASDLHDWAEPGLPETATSIDDTWERVSVTDDPPPGILRRFGRVKIE